jgi:hypothetical protein
MAAWIRIAFAAVIAAYAALVLFFLWAVNGSSDYVAGPSLNTAPVAVPGSIGTALLITVTLFAVRSPTRREATPGGH